jgi:hypothetical protein
LCRALAQQAEEEARLAEEAAKLSLAASDDVLELRALVRASSVKASAAAVKKLEVEGGLAGRMRVLYEVCDGADHRPKQTRLACVSLIDFVDAQCDWLCVCLLRLKRIAPPPPKKL